MSTALSMRRANRASFNQQFVTWNRTSFVFLQQLMSETGSCVGYQEHRPFRGPQYRCGFSGTELKIVFCSLFHLPSKHCMNLNPCIVAWEEWNMLSEEGKELIAVSVLGQCSCLLFRQLWSWLNSKLLFSKQEILDHAFSETGWSNKYMKYFPSRGLIPEMYNLWWELMFWGDTFSPSGNFTWSRSVSHV